GQEVSVDAPDGAPLLYVLNELRVSGSKFGCGRSQCGACEVLIDGDVVRSCDAHASAAAGRAVTTLAGLGEPDAPGPLQRAFVEERAAQCGYCTSGMIIRAQSLLDRNPNPDDWEVRTALAGNLCRCGTHNRIVRAVLRAAQEA